MIVFATAYIFLSERDDCILDHSSPEFSCTDKIFKSLQGSTNDTLSDRTVRHDNILS